MRLVSFQMPGSTATEVGVIVGDEGVVSLHRALPAGLLAEHEGMPEVIARWAQLQPQMQALLTAAPHARLPEVQLLAPVPRPPKLLAIGLNYLDHVNEKIVGDQGRESRAVPEHQLWFTKLGHAINGPYDDIVLPKVSERTDYEAELVAVIGQRCKHVPRERAHEVIFGYCVGNDVSVRDWQKRTSQWTLGKSFDTHAPFGPWLTTADELNGDPHTLDLRCWVNGELRQQSNTSLMIHDVWSQIALLSQAMTLEPGDVIYTGTCSGVGAAFDPPKFLRAGDVVRVEIDKLGAIEARCVDEA
jgi:2-keto-4-pentenoate hydratase/2-oxohepta-3-ene-1,7-dioic acid hydratase in catechol pathway